MPKNGGSREELETVMDKIRRIAMGMASLSVFRGVLDRAVPGAFYRLLVAAGGPEEKFCGAWGAFFAALCEAGGCGNFARSLTEPVLSDENAFSRAAAGGEEDFPPEMVAAAARDVSVLREAAAVTPEDLLRSAGFPQDGRELSLPAWRAGEPVPELRGDARGCVSKLAGFYRRNGCGMYCRYRAFIWRGGEIRPVAHPDRTRLSDLKGYEAQRGMAVENTEGFLRGLPANNCLLYGDRGTGKSSTVKALLNEYYPRGLRMIEIPKESLADFPLLADRIAALPLKFIVFIDDLAFNREDDAYASLKAVLEGGLAARPENALIYATSNRRHLVRETFSGREGDEVHRSDSIQEGLSLYDRFGLSIRFTLPGREQFLQIVHRLAEQRGLRVDAGELDRGAEKWALTRGGRSPRCAKQYIRTVEARVRAAENRGTD